MVLLMWIYFTSAILLYAAACARAYGATEPPLFGMPANWQDPIERLQAQADAFEQKQAAQRDARVPQHAGENI